MYVCMYALRNCGFKKLLLWKQKEFIAFTAISYVPQNWVLSTQLSTSPNCGEDKQEYNQHITIKALVINFINLKCWYY